MFNSSAQARSWMFKSSAELATRREAANRKFIMERANGMSEDAMSKNFLTPSEEKMLSKSYEILMLRFCQKFQPPMPKNVIGCSFHYFKRFYLDNSVMDYHPKDIIVTCVYLATKVEEFNVSISQFVANVKGDRDRAIEIILNYELLLMQQLNFDLSVYNPFRPVEGLLIDIKTRYPQFHDPERLRPAIDEFLEKIQFSDACFLYSPPQIALAAIAYGVVKNKGNFDGYLSDILFDDHPRELGFVKDAIKNMFQMIRNDSTFLNEPMKIALEKKLEKCRNQENNPTSSAYKRKLEELLDEDESEPAQKYSRLLEHEENRMKEDEQNLGITFLNT